MLMVVKTKFIQALDIESFSWCGMGWLLLVSLTVFNIGMLDAIETLELRLVVTYPATHTHIQKCYIVTSTHKQLCYKATHMYV